MAGGRPTAYDDSILEKTIDYLENHESYDDLVPSIAGLSIHLDVSRTTIYAWTKAEGNEQFLYTVNKLTAMQERKLVNGGLNNVMNASITKLLLANHGYADKQEIAVTEKDVTPWAELESGVDE